MPLEKRCVVNCYCSFQSLFSPLCLQQTLSVHHNLFSPLSHILGLKLSPKQSSYESMLSKSERYHSSEYNSAINKACALIDDKKKHLPLNVVLSIEDLL